MPVKQEIELTEYNNLPVFCFNKDSTRVAVSPNTNQIHIYASQSGSWKLQATLSEHTERVTGIDWSQNANRLVTCAADRNSYVWTEEKPGDWKPSLVILRIDRAAITVKWSPSEAKFAVGSGSKSICVCYYEEGNHWWVSKHIRKPIRSSVLCIDWHPASTVLAAGSSDFCVRVFSAAIKEVEKKPNATSWGEKITFGAVLAEFETPDKGWVHSISFSPSGTRLVWVSHGSMIHVADTSNPTMITYSARLDMLPFVSVLFLDESVIIAAGHNNCPYKLTWDGKTITNQGDIDVGGAKKAAAPEKQSAMSKFRNMDTLAQSGGVTSSGSNKTHANTITCLIKMPGIGFASSGLDSKIAIWEKV